MNDAELISLRRLVFRANSIVSAIKLGGKYRLGMALTYYHDALVSHQQRFENKGDDDDSADEVE